MFSSPVAAVYMIDGVDRNTGRFQKFLQTSENTIQTLRRDVLQDGNGINAIERSRGNIYQPFMELRFYESQVRILFPEFLVTYRPIARTVIGVHDPR